MDSETSLAQEECKVKQEHTPCIDARYWTAITLASVWGTNLGDLYAHESGLGIGSGLAVLALLTVPVFLVERFEARRHEAYYWLIIILIRTGATNIADWLAYRVRVPAALLTLGLLALLALFAWGTGKNRRAMTAGSYTLPQTDAAYWAAMLSAGVFGTVMGDICEHAIGEGPAAVALTLVLLAVLTAAKARAAQAAVYWTIVAAARTTGTAIGDWLAESRTLHIGLRTSTILSGTAFVAVLALWRTTALESRAPRTVR